MFSDLNAAITEAQATSNKTIILAVSGTLAAGEYKIPNGIKLLIPYGENDKGDFTKIAFFNC